ncbi:MAG: ECF transporter S component [Oscillospiraceae bacterium]
MRSNEGIKKLARLGMLTALSVVFIVLVRIPFPPAPFLVYDPGDVPILIAAFLYGPWHGVAMTALVSAIQAFALGGDGIIGGVMHLFATGVFCLVAGYIYRSNKSMKSAVIALIVGSISMTAVMVGCNLVLTPIFLGQLIEDVVPMLLPIIIPFNLLKSGVNAVITFIVYKPVHKLFNKVGRKKDSQNA